MHSKKMPPNRKDSWDVFLRIWYWQISN